MGLGIRTALPEPLDMMIRRGVSGRPATQVQAPGPITTEQSMTESVPDEQGIPRFADGLIDFAKALLPTAAGAGVGALLGGGEGAMLGAQAGASFSEGKATQEREVEKQKATAEAARTKNQIDAFKAATDRIEATRASDNTVEPKYFQSGPYVLKVNPDGTRENLTITNQKGQFINTKDGKVFWGDPATGDLVEAYKPPEQTGPDEGAVKAYNTKIADINEKLIKGTFDVDQALTQAELAATGAGLEWSPITEQSLRSTFKRFEIPERARAFNQLTSPVQTEVLKSETFVDAIDNVDQLLNLPVVQQNVGLIPGTFTELTAKLNSGSLAPEVQRFYSELKNAFDLLVRNRTGAALSMGEEQFYNTLFGSTRGSVDNLRQSIDVQRQSALGFIENAFDLGPVKYVETNPKRITNQKLREMILADPEGIPDAFIDEMDRRMNLGLIF